MKFGGSSVADADKIKNVARRIAEAREHGDDVLAVVSARGKTTDGLVALAREISDRPDPREMDMLLSTGERISCALVAMALHDLGHGARSFTGSQAGILTDGSHTRPRSSTSAPTACARPWRRATSSSWRASRACQRTAT